MNKSRIEEIKELHKEHLSHLPNVHSVGIGKKFKDGEKTAQNSIICNVVRKVRKEDLYKAERIPPILDGLPTDVQQRKPFKMLGVGSAVTDAVAEDHKLMRRPIPGGVSFGLPNITGTFGAWVKFNLPGKPNATGMLTNWHVGVGDEGNIGDPVTQPGFYDIGGAIQEKHYVGILAAYEAIHFNEGVDLSDCSRARAYVGFGNFMAKLLGSHSRILPPYTPLADTEANLVDAAIVVPYEPIADYVDASILGIGKISSTKIKQVGVEDIGLPIWKSGRTTGVTNGIVEQVAVTITVNYGGKTATFEDQIMGKIGSAGGDSGSLGLVVNWSVPFGLLFAGNGEGDTVFCQIRNVMDALNIVSFL